MTLLHPQTTPSRDAQARDLVDRLYGFMQNDAPVLRPGALNGLIELLTKTPAGTFPGVEISALIKKAHIADWFASLIKQEVANFLSAKVVVKPLNMGDRQRGSVKLTVGQNCWKFRGRTVQGHTEF